MALPAQTADLLQKVALLDVVLGLGLLVYGSAGDEVGLIFGGVGLAVMGALMFLWARSQRPRPDGPIEGGPIGGSPIS